MNIRGRPIMVVEDESMDQELIRMAFKEVGVKDGLHMVNSGEEAIAYLMGEGPYSDRAVHPYPALIITDLKMCLGNGFTVLEHLKANPSWAVIPTIVLTSSEDPDDIRQAYVLGASAYHVKPNDYGALRDLLGWLNGYWRQCRTPEVTASGQLAPTEPQGKMGAQFERSADAPQHRVNPASPRNPAQAAGSEHPSPHSPTDH